MAAAACAAWRTRLELVLVLMPALVVAGMVLLLLACCCGVADAAGRFCAEAGAGDCGAEEDVPCAGAAVLAGEGRCRSLAAAGASTGVGVGAAKGPVADVGVAGVDCVGAAGVGRAGAAASGTRAARGGEGTTVSCVAGRA